VAKIMKSIAFSLFLAVNVPLAAMPMPAVATFQKRSVDLKTQPNQTGSQLVEDMRVAIYSASGLDMTPTQIADVESFIWDIDEASSVQTVSTDQSGSYMGCVFGNVGTVLVGGVVVICYEFSTGAIYQISGVDIGIVVTPTLKPLGRGAGVGGAYFRGSKKDGLYSCVSGGFAIGYLGGKGMHCSPKDAGYSNCGSSYNPATGLMDYSGGPCSYQRSRNPESKSFTLIAYQAGAIIEMAATMVLVLRLR